MKRSLACAIVSGLLLTPAWAQEPPTSTEPFDFHFQVRPLELSWWASTVDTRSSKFAEYRDLGSGFQLPVVDLTGTSADARQQLSVRLTHAWRDDAFAELEYDIAGRFKFALEHNRIPHRFGNDGRSIWTATDPGHLEISNLVQATNQAAIAAQFAVSRPGVNFAFLNALIGPTIAAADRIDLGLRRDRTKARFDFAKLGGVGLSAEFTHELRHGNRPYGGSFGFSNATEIPEPIEYRTLGGEVRGEYNGERGGFAGGYRFSVFKNRIDALIFDNPFRATDATDPNAYTAPGAGSINGAVEGVVDLAPDNQSDTLFLQGRWRAKNGFWAQGDVNRSKLTQDDRLLAYTRNSAIVGIDFDGTTTFNPRDRANLPVDRAGRSITLTSVHAALGSRFTRWVDLQVRGRYDHYSDDADRIEFPGYVRFHAVWEPIGRVTVPFDNERQSVTGEVGLNLPGSSRLELSYGNETWKRKFREVGKTDEDVLRATFTTRPAGWLNLRVGYGRGDRTNDRYHVEAQEFSFVEPEGVNNQPRLRKFDEAARDYDEISGNVQLTLKDDLVLDLGTTRRKEDYPDSRFGLTRDELDQYHLDISYNPSEKLAFSLFGHRASRTSDQRGRQSAATLSVNPLDNWDLTLDERTNTYGLTLDAALGKRWHTQLGGNWSKSDGGADFFSPPGGTPNLAFDFDNYEDVKLFSGLWRLDYQISPSVQAGVSYRLEDYTIDSFIRQGLRNYLPGALLLNADNGDYRGKVFAVNLRASF